MGASVGYASMAAVSDHDAIAVPDDVMRALIAEELDRMRGFIEELGVRLCLDPAVVQQYSEVLQGLDELSQRNENLAVVLRASDMVGAIDRITLGALRDSLSDSVHALAAGADRPVSWVQV